MTDFSLSDFIVDENDFIQIKVVGKGSFGKVYQVKEAKKGEE